LIASVGLIGSLTVPLILLVVVCGIQIDKKEFFNSARVIVIHLVVNIPAALLLNYFIIEKLMGLDKGFQAAVFTLLILPPPFILTLYMNPERKDELCSVDNSLTLHTIITILVFIFYNALNPVI